MYVDVAVCLPLARTFVYQAAEPVEVGCRVVVPFRKREVEGFVVGLREKAPEIEIHSITEMIDRTPFFDRTSLHSAVDFRLLRITPR